MLTSLFGSLMEELGKMLKIEHLQPDANNACLIKFKGGVLVQLEMHRSDQFLIIGSKLGSPPVGKYRENLFTEALKMNGLTDNISQRIAFAYSKLADELILQALLPVEGLTATMIADILPSFIERAKRWQEAVKNGEVPIVQSSGEAKPFAGSGIFGLKP